MDEKGLRKLVDANDINALIAHTSLHGGAWMFKTFLANYSCTFQHAFLTDRLDVAQWMCFHDIQATMTYRTGLLRNTALHLISNTPYSFSVVLKFAAPMAAIVNVPNKYNNRAIDWAARNGHWETVNALIACGANVWNVDKAYHHEMLDIVEAQGRAKHAAALVYALLRTRVPRDMAVLISKYVLATRCYAEWKEK